MCARACLPLPFVLQVALHDIWAYQVRSKPPSAGKAVCSRRVRAYVQTFCVCVCVWCYHQKTAINLKASLIYTKVKWSTSKGGANATQAYMPTSSKRSKVIRRFVPWSVAVSKIVFNCLKSNFSPMSRDNFSMSWYVRNPLPSCKHTHWVDPALTNPMCTRFNLHRRRKKNRHRRRHRRTQNTHNVDEWKIGVKIRDARAITWSTASKTFRSSFCRTSVSCSYNSELSAAHTQNQLLSRHKWQ